MTTRQQIGVPRLIRILFTLLLINLNGSLSAFQEVRSTDSDLGSQHEVSPEGASTAPRKDNQPSAMSDARTYPVVGPNGPALRSMYAEPHAPPLVISTDARLRSLVRDGNLYLSLRDALAFAIDNNLNVEVQRYDLSIAEADLVRAKGGGTTRGLNLSITQAPEGVGGPGSPLLNASAVSVTPGSPSVLDLTALNSDQPSVRDLSTVGASPYSLGSALPLFDPQVDMRFGWLRRDDASNLASLSGTTVVQPNTNAYESALASAGYVQGFGPGTQIQASVDNAAEALYPNSSELNPFQSPTLSVGVLQPLLRSRGRRVNERYIRIASLDKRISSLVFRQQLLNTVYGVARLYFDLVSLRENARVKRDALAAAKKLFENDRAQVDQGTLPPLELTRAESLVSASELDVVQANALVEQEEAILKDQLVRTGSADPSIASVNIIPTDTIDIPGQEPQLQIQDLMHQALTSRPDLKGSYLQVSAGQEAVLGSEDNIRPELDVFANAQLRGAGEGTFAPLGSPGTGFAQAPIADGGLRVDRIVEAGIQLNLPIRNRVAEADAARDQLILRQSQAQAQLLKNRIQTDVTNALIAVRAARSEYDAAVRSRVYQESLLQAERDKYSVGASTNLALIENQAYLAQARSTEVAAKSNWMKAHLTLDQAVGDLLEKNSIVYGDAVAGRLTTGGVYSHIGGTP
jgi:outer membrane protein